MKNFLRKNKWCLIFIACYWMLQLILIYFRVMRTQSFQQVSSQSGPQWEKYQLFMYLDNTMGRLMYTTCVLFVVLAVLLVLGFLSWQKVLVIFGSSYLGAWLLSHVGPIWGGAGLSNYTLELRLSCYQSALFLGIGFLIWALRLIYSKIKAKKGI